ncbi:MAG: hypothetical protein ACO3JJ_11235 [Opitutaceae bacterium]
MEVMSQRSEARYPTGARATRREDDPARPIKGREFRDLGAMLAHERRIFRDGTLRTQLNGENPFDWSGARLVSGNYDTEGVLGATNALIPIRWELRRPRNFILTATFGF